MEGWGEILAAIQAFGASAWLFVADWVMGLDGATIARIYWTGLSWATIYAAIAIFISSTDDAFLDLYFWVLQGQRVLTRPFRFVPTTKTIMEAPEKRLAIMVPAWQESDVIARMLMNTLSSLEYGNYDIFVGCYPNDPDTLAEVDRIARQHKQVVRAMVGPPGPTSKADCLNWMIQNIFAHEKKVGVHYDAFAMQDSEDVIHPLSFKVVNAYLDRSDMVQLPVLSMPRKWNELIPCHYMDEFAEWHGKDLIARSAMTRLVPSAGVATSFSRWCIELLCQERDNQPFNTDSLTEDYDVGHRLFQAGLKSEFVRFWAKVPVGEIKRRHGSGMRTLYRRELVGTREYFPDSLSVSVKQKSRWMLGISYLGWKQLGWIGPFSHRYFLYRDRKAIWIAPTGMLAYAIVFQWALYWMVTKLVPSVGTLPPLIDPNSWVWTLVLINFLFLVNRVVHRVIFTASAHGLKHAILSPVRMVVGNYVGFLASMRAARRFAVHMVTGERITWDKTMHAYPSMAEISGQGNTLGDALKFFGIVNDATLVTAEAEAAATGQGLATVLVKAGHATEEEIATAWSEISRHPVEAFDPLQIADEARDAIRLDLARKFSVFPPGQSRTGLKLALGEPLTPEAEAELKAAIKPVIEFVIAPASDVAFGLRFAWDRAPLEPDLRAARIFKRLGLADDEQIAAIWMGIRRISAAGEPPFDFIRIARESGIVSDAGWKILTDSQPELASGAPAPSAERKPVMSATAKSKGRGRFTRVAILLGASAAALGWVTTAGADLTAEEIAAARDRAFQLNAQGRCSEAMPIWEELGSVLCRASDYLDAANCAIEAGDSARAVSDLWEVVRRRDQLDTEGQLFALRALGYQAEAQGDWNRALIGWDYAAQISDALSDKLRAARASRLSGRTSDAQARLWQVRPGEFEGAQLAQYYDEQAQVLRESQPEMAAQYMARAIAIDDQSWRRFDHGLMLQAANQPRPAISEFRTVLAQDPANTVVRLSLAYALRGIGENAEAADQFGQVIALQPGNAGIREDQAYAYKDAGQEAEAAAAFISVIDLLQAQGGDEAHLYRVRREVTELERRTSGFAYTSYRNEGVSLSGGLQDSVASSSLGAEFTWRPDALYENGTGITAFARGYVGMEPGAFNLDTDTAQLGIGARWKPFQSVDFNLSGERLIALGDNARDDWMLRASYGWTNGYDWRPDAASWNYTSVYADLAYIPGDNEYFGAYAQVRRGRRFRTAEGWTVTPYVTAVAQYSDDIYGSQDRFEVGPGVSVSHWFDEDDHHAYRRRVDFDVEYLYDVESGGDALMARVVFSF